MSTTPDPETPSDPPRGPASDTEAAGLMEMGLSDPASTGGTRATVPSASELADRFPDLEILELLGQGGMGVVYRARQRTLDREVALKVLPEQLSRDPAFAERFTREARALAKLNHPHVVGVYEFGEKEGVHFLLMEYVDGVTLRQLMRAGTLSPREALAIVPQICEALQYAHDQGVVHRDVKPENILLDRKGRVRVADFGLAKLAEPGAVDFTLTGTHQVMGTLHYMAPEQYKTPADVDHRADIFSLGVVFYEMLTGELPLGNFKKPSSTKTLDARIDEIVMRALEREREARYQQAKEFEDDVETVVREPAGGAPRCGPSPFTRMRERHAARRSARRPAGPRTEVDDRPVSAWTVWAWWVALAAAPVGFGVWGFVFNVAARDASYLGTVIGALVALGIGGVALVLAVVALVRTSRLRDRLRGRRRSLALLVLLTILIPLFASHFVGEERRMRRQQRKQREWQHAERLRREQGSFIGGDVEITGLAPDADVSAIRRGVLTLWSTYLAFMRRGSGTVRDALGERFYAPEDVEAFLDDDVEVANQRAREGVYGLGAMGKGHLPVPPWELELRQVRVDRWEREARVRAWQKGPDRIYRVEFKIKRAGDRWVFALEPPEIVPEVPDEDK